MTPKGKARVRAAVLMRDKHLCWLCGSLVGRKHNNGDKNYAFTVDHVVPVSKGGKYTVENLRTAHKSCNVRRGNADHMDESWNSVVKARSRATTDVSATVSRRAPAAR